MSTTKSTKRIVKRKKKSDMTAKHQNDSKSGGIDALLPSLIGVVILVIAIMAKMGFRGRSTVAGIDLGTTNSVICVQAQEKGGRCTTFTFILCQIICLMTYFILSLLDVSWRDSMYT